MGIILTDGEMQIDWTNDDGESTDKLEISKSDLLFMLRTQVVKVVKHLDEANDLKDLDNKLQELKEELSKYPIAKLMTLKSRRA